MTDFQKLQDIISARTPGPWIISDCRPQELTIHPKGIPLVCDFPSEGIDCMPDAKFFVTVSALADLLMDVVRAAEDSPYQHHAELKDALAALKAACEELP